MAARLSQPELNSVGAFKFHIMVLESALRSGVYGAAASKRTVWVLVLVMLELSVATPRRLCR